MGNCINKQNLESATIENSINFSLQGLKCNAKVIDIHDGDTITLAFVFCEKICYKSCRIEGVDCAEIRTTNKKEKEIGFEAKNFVSNLILNKIIQAEFSDKNDKYGRLLAKIFFQGNSLDKLLISKKFGYEYHGEKKKKFDEWYV